MTFQIDKPLSHPEAWDYADKFINYVRTSDMARRHIATDVNNIIAMARKDGSDDAAALKQMRAVLSDVWADPSNRNWLEAKHGDAIRAALGL